MKTVLEKQTNLFNKMLSQFIPVISNRSELKTKIRLLINYAMESLVLVAAMLSVCLSQKITVPHFAMIIPVIRASIYIVSIKLNVIDSAILVKLLVILQSFTQASTYSAVFEGVLFIVHLMFAARIALSCEQRRGQFDQRLGVLVPYIKQVIVILCVFLIHGTPYYFKNIFYPPVAFAVIHFILCHLDQMYNFSIKKILQGLSLLCLSFTAILCVLYSSNLNRTSVMMIGSISYVIILGWIASGRQFDNFKIVQQNPNSFAQWDYKQYFQKLIYLIKQHQQQGNQETIRGFYKYHEKICFSAQCPIRYCHQLQREGKLLNPHSEQDIKLIIKYVESYLKNQLEIATIKFPHLKRFYIFYSSPSLEALRYCNKDSFIEYRQADRIEKMFQVKNIQFQKESNQKVLKQVTEYIEHYLDTSNHLWRLLYDDNIDFGRFQKLGINLLDLKLTILQYENHKMADNNTFRLIKQFRDYILDEKIQNSKMLEQQTASKLYNFIQIHTKEYPILIISAESETLERIENVNSSCSRLIGYTKKELIEKKLNDILPQFVSTFHTRLLTQRSKELLYEKQKKLFTLVYVVTRSGYVLEAELNILQLNSMKGRRWSCILTPTHEPNILIVTNQKGIIQGMTSNAITIGLDLNSLGKPICPDQFEDLYSNISQWSNLQNKINHLIEREQDIDKLKKGVTTIRMKSCISLIAPTELCVFEIKIQKRQSNNKVLTSKEAPNHCQQQTYMPLQWSFNYPDLISNINYHVPIQLKIKQQQKYEFIDYGEGINEMRYLNGQIQYKQDKSESSFEKQQTQNSMVQIIDFNMKKETYQQLMQKSKNKYPKPIIQFSIWIVVVIILIIGMSIANFLLVYLNSSKHLTNASVIANLDILKFQYISITHSSIELAYISQGIWSRLPQISIHNMTSKLNTIAQLSPLLTKNQSYINTFTLNYQISSSSSFYDLISQFKLQANKILNFPNEIYDFNASSPVFQLMNISVNYMNEGWSKLSQSLLNRYTDTVSSDFQIYLFQFIILLSLIVLIAIRIFFIVSKMNKQKTRLFSIYLEIEQSIIQKVLERNNTFKSMLKHNKAIQNDDEQFQINLQTDKEQGRSARKRIKAMAKINYFFYFLLWAILCTGLYSLNAYQQELYIDTITSNYKQIVEFGQANIIQENTNTLLYFAATGIQNNFKNETIMNYTKNRIASIYITQMKYRQSLLVLLNKGLFSQSFADFFLDYWINNACPYLSYQTCENDYYGVIKHGGDQFWSMYVRKLDQNTAKIDAAGSPLPVNYYKTFAKLPDTIDTSTITKFYSQQILRIPHLRILQQIKDQIKYSVQMKTYIFGSVIAATLIGALIYFSVCLKKMRNRMQKIQEIIGLIPYKKLSTVINFKKYIRRKYQEQGL